MVHRLEAFSLARERIQPVSICAEQAEASLIGELLLEPMQPADGLELFTGLLLSLGPRRSREPLRPGLILPPEGGFFYLPGVGTGPTQAVQGGELECRIGIKRLPQFECLVLAGAGRPLFCCGSCGSRRGLFEKRLLAI